MGPSGRFHSYIVILDCLGHVCIWVELLVQRRFYPIFVRDVGSTDIHECFCGLTGSQRTPGRWGITLYIDLLGTVMKLGKVVSVSVHGEQTQLRLLEKTHQSNGNLRKNDSVLMPKGEFKLALNSARCGAVARACVW